MGQHERPKPLVGASRKCGACLSHAPFFIIRASIWVLSAIITV
jgi:hypothetical protein